MSRDPNMQKFCTAAVLVSAGAAMAGEAILVHDIVPPHPRYTQLTQMAADVVRRTQGTLISLVGSARNRELRGLHY